MGGISRKPYPRDLRLWVAQAVDNHEGSLRPLARHDFVSLSFVVYLLALRRQTDSLAPRPHRGDRRSAIDRPDLDRLRQRVADQPDAPLPELAQRLARAAPPPSAAPCAGRDHPQEEGAPCRRTVAPRRAPQAGGVRPQLATTDPEHRVSVDEFAAPTAVVRTDGRATVGERLFLLPPGAQSGLGVPRG